MRVFLDANVLFSAANAESNIARLVSLVKKSHAAVSSDFAIEEARRNIALKRPAWQASFDDVIEDLEIVASTLFRLTVELDEKDQPILCTAIRAKCDLLATGDRRHFSHLFDTTVEGVTIVSLLGLAQRVVSSR